MYWAYETMVIVWKMYILRYIYDYISVVDQRIKQYIFLTYESTYSYLDIITDLDTPYSKKLLPTD